MVRLTLASPHGDNPHDPDMSIAAYVPLTLLICRQFPSSKLLLPNAVGHIVGTPSFSIVEDALHILPVGSDGLCILR